MQVDDQRLKEDILQNAEFGEIETVEGHGRTLLTGTNADRQAREYLVDRMEAAGLEVRIDTVGNIAGRWVPPTADPEAAPVAAGSHLDSVPAGGIFDGPLGVYGALEAVRTLQDSNAALDRPLDVVSFTEEEGTRFDVGVLGSSAATGLRDPEESLDFCDENGTTLREHLDRIGFLGDDSLDPSEWDAWLEIHVEQSTELEEAAVPVGVVTAITGLTNCAVEITGESNHAGGTLMPQRTDALVAAGTFVRDVERAAREIAATDSPFGVATVGRIDVEPNARNVIPGEVRLSIDARDVDESIMDELVDRAAKSLARLEAARGVDTTLDRVRTIPPTHMADRCMRSLHRGCEAAGVGTIELPSGGGHDSMSVANATDVGMLFVRSKDGISHSPQEWTDWEDCTTAVAVLASAIADLAGGNGS